MGNKVIQDFFKLMPLNILKNVKGLDLHIKSEECKKEVDTLLQKSVLIGGKRLRPLLTYLMADFLAIDLKEIKTLAETIELVHAASLAHDDVVDDAKTRRGIPSINVQASNKKAVLAGDYLLADVIVELSKLERPTLLKEMSLVIKDLAEGEWVQSDACLKREYTRELITEIAKLKTSSVMKWCFVSPSVYSSQSDMVVNYARELGDNLGIAFQLIDDTLDFSENSNKDHLLDLDNGIVNSVLYEWLELNPALKTSYLEGALMKEIWSPTHLDEAVELVRARAYRHLDKCHEIIDILCQEVDDSRSFEERSKKAKVLKHVVDFLGKRDH